MSAATINAMFQWIVAFFKKVMEHFNKLLGIVSPEEDSSVAE